MMLSPNFDNIPSELKQYPQWVAWKSVPRKDGGKPTKPPYQPNGKLAETNNPQTWNTFDSVEAAADRFDGIGFVLTQDDPFTGLDFDNCRCPAFDTLDPEIAGGFNMVLPQVAAHVRSLDSYTEKSPTGKGLHTFVKGILPVAGTKKGDYEAYQSGRFFTVTGHHIEGCPRTIESRQAEVDTLYQAIFGTPEKPPEPEKKARTDIPPLDRNTLLEKAFQSVNGAEIRRLYEGDYSSYSSQSEADLALCSHLAFWLAGDPGAIDAAFRQSGLYRKKWDEKHYGDERTYGEATIEKAIAGCSTSYSDQPQGREPIRETAPPEAWPEPVPFNDYSHLPEFPVEAIPGSCGQMVETLANSCQVDPGLPGSMMLAALSTAIGGKIKIDLVSHKEPGNLYLISVIGSGNRKTEVVSQLAEPVYSYQKERQEALIPVIREVENKRRVLEKRLETLQKKAANQDDSTERDLIIRGDCHDVLKEIDANPVIRKPVYLVDDITPEALGQLMADNQERAAILSAEGGIFRIIAGLYHNGQANFDLFLKGHAGDYWSNNRIGRESKTMEAPALSLGLSVQPDVIDEIGKNSEFRGRGLSARFLYSLCQSKAGYRTRQSTPISSKVKDGYHRLIESLMAIEGKHELRLTPDAHTTWNSFYSDVELLLRPGEELERLVDWGSKLSGAVARIAGLLHFAEHGPSGIEKPISSDKVEMSCFIGGYYLEHAKAVFGLMGEDSRLAAGKKILDYLKRCRPQSFKGSDLFDHTGFQSMKEIEPGIGILIERGFIREIGKPDVEKRRGRPEAMTYEVNPKVFSKL